MGEYSMKLMDIDQEHLGIPDTAYDAEIELSSGEFARIVRDLKDLGESVKIEVTKEGVRWPALPFLYLLKGPDIAPHRSSLARRETSAPPPSRCGRQRAVRAVRRRRTMTMKWTKTSSQRCARGLYAYDVRNILNPQVNGDDDEEDAPQSEEDADGADKGDAEEDEDKPEVEEDEDEVRTQLSSDLCTTHTHDGCAQDTGPRKKSKKRKATESPKKPASKKKAAAKPKAAKGKGKKKDEDDDEARKVRLPASRYRASRVVTSAQVAIHLTQSVALTFSIKYLQHFSKSAPLANYVRLNMSNVRRRP